MHFKTFRHPAYQMMVQAQGDMDVPPELLGDFYWRTRPVLNACNFVGAAGVIQEGIAVDPLLAECELEAHELYQAKLDHLSLGCGRSATTSVAAGHSAGFRDAQLNAALIASS